MEKGYHDKTETSEVQAERIRHQRSHGDSLAALQGQHLQITVNRVLPARRKMMKNKANRPADCVVTAMLQCLQTEDSVRGRALVREAIQRRMSGPRGVEDSSPCVSEGGRRPSLRRDFAASAQLPCLPYFQSGTRPSWWTCCTRTKSRLSGGACTWEPRGESIANTCRPW